MNRDKQKYYWQKLDKDFFNEYKIRSLMALKKGDTYICILLQLKNECLNYDGVLRYSQTRAYTTAELACVIGRSPALLKEALKVLEEAELITIQEDGTIIMNDLDVGYETGKARRMRDYRNAQMGENVANENATENAQKLLQMGTDIRDKRLENRIEEDLKIKEAIGRALEMGFSPKIIDDALTIFEKEDYPKTADFYQKILNILTDSTIYNKDGYIYQSAMNERNKA